jgi:hypothetical protein
VNDKIKKSLANVRRELRGIPQDALDAFLVSLERNSYSAHLNAHHERHSVLGRGSHCSKTDLLLLSGRETTNNAGKATLLIDTLLCGVVSEGLPSSQSFLLFTEPDFVATPVSSMPSFVTVTTSSTKVPTQAGVTDRDANPIDQPTLSNVKVEVTTWKPDGTPAANTAFSWICTLEAVRSPFLVG